MQGLGPGRTDQGPGHRKGHHGSVRCCACCYAVRATNLRRMCQPPAVQEKLTHPCMGAAVNSMKRAKMLGFIAK
eukprot:4180427-Karenia_brevis.AAC.1